MLKFLFLIIIDVFLCAIPFPKPSVTKFSNLIPNLYLKLAIFYIPDYYDDKPDKKQITTTRNRVYWQNHYLNECNITLPFEPKKHATSRR